MEPPRVETIAELFVALESPLLTYALRLVQQPDLAEDMVQDAFMKLHTHFDQVREPRRWLYRTVHNAALNYRRKSNRIVSIDTQAPTNVPPAREMVDPELLPDEQMARWEDIGQVRLSLETLDERSRELIRLKFTEGLSYQEMGLKLGLTVGHVGYLLHHALKDVAADLTRKGDFK